MPAQASFTFSGDVIGERPVPVAEIVSTPAFAVVGSVVRVSGETSYSPDGSELTYLWSFLGEVPIGSVVAREGLTKADDAGSAVTFSPDKTGFYVVQLIVYNGVFYSSPVTSVVHVKPILIPNGTGIVPDGKFIWEYLRDAWFELENREWFETLWSALIQIVGADLMRVYQTDFNKSIRDIQDRVQKRWISYEPWLPITPGSTSYRLVEEAAGFDATSKPADALGILLSPTEVRIIEGVVYPSALVGSLTISTSLNQNNLGTYEIRSASSQNSGYILPANAVPGFASDRVYGQNISFRFGFQSKTWATGDFVPDGLSEHLSTDQTLLDTLTTGQADQQEGKVVLSGDVIHIPTGPNQGFYRVVRSSGTYVEVDRAPPSSEDGQRPSSVYRPVRLTVSQQDRFLTESFYLPSNKETTQLLSSSGTQVVHFANRTLTCLRARRDTSRVTPSISVTADQIEVPSGVSSQPWRLPNTLSSDTLDFEALGVREWDVLEWVIEREGSGLSSTVKTQVTGADRGRLGFTLSTEPMGNGMIPAFPDTEIKRIFDELGITGASTSISGQVVFAGTAKEVLAEMKSPKFTRAFFNKNLSPTSIITVAGIGFTVRPVGILRNSLIPIDDDVLAIPTMQEYIASPKILREGEKTYREVRGTKYPVYQSQNLYFENADFCIGGKTAYSGTSLLSPGTATFKAFGANFLDRGVSPGDSLFIDSPSALEGEYLILDVPTAHELLLSRTITPADNVSLGDEVQVAARVVRRKGGNFLRFAYSKFYAKKPAPRRLWAESTFFDNGQAIENNFGVVVGLSRDQVNTAMSGLSYRQAVTGLLYAYTRGPSMDRVRLGVQVLLGLPYAEHRGVVRSIEEVYRRDLNGVPIQGRILVEDVNDSGSPLGITRVYLFPVDEGSRDLAGVDTNPVTGVPYVVGDLIEKFSPICKGARVLDYVTDPIPEGSSSSRVLQQFHSLRVQVNDFLFNKGEIALVSDFLKKVTPNHISAYLTSATEEFDPVTVGEKVGNTVTVTEGVLIDDALTNLSVPQVFGGRDMFGNVYPRTDGVYTVRGYGRDLLSDGTTTVVSDHLHVPLVRAGDVLRIFGSPLAGMYEVVSAAEGSAVLDRPLPAGEGLFFSVLRRVGHTLFSGPATVVGSVATIPGFGPWELVEDGDVFVLNDQKYDVVGCGPGTRGTTVLAENQLLLSRPYVGPGGQMPCRIVRPALIPRYTGDTMQAVCSGTNEAVLSGNDALFVEAGDWLERTSGAAASYYVLAASGGVVQVTPPVPDLAGGAMSVRLRKSRSANTPVGVGARHAFPREGISIRRVFAANTLIGSVNASAPKVVIFNFTLDAQTPAFLAPGDLLEVLTGTNSTDDVGYGAGVYPVLEVSGNTAKVSHDLDGGLLGNCNVLRRIG